MAQFTHASTGGLPPSSSIPTRSELLRRAAECISRLMSRYGTTPKEFAQALGLPCRSFGKLLENRNNGTHRKNAGIGHTGNRVPKIVYAVLERAELDQETREALEDVVYYAERYLVRKS